MLTYTFGDTEGLPIYAYLCRCVKNDILAGKLRAGERLPSKRSLARHLELSVVTVENAYAQLIAEGYVYAEEKRGYYVAEVETGRPTVRRQPDRIAVPPSPACFMDFRTNNIHAGLFPFSVWAKLMRAVLTERDAELLQAPPAGGALQLRQAISDYLYDFRGMSVSPACIIVGAGTDYLYNLIIQLLGRDKVFAVEDPGYSKIAKIYGANGVRCAYAALDGRGVRVESLRASGADVAHISPAHHFPTGIVTPITRRQELLAWAAQAAERYIIEDDYDSEFRFSGRPIPTMQSIDGAGRVIYMNTFSKSLAPSVRISYMVLPAALLERFQDRLGFYACTVPSFEQYTLAKFIAGGYFEQHINRMKKFYRQQRDMVIGTIQNSGLRDMVEIREADAGLHFIMALRTTYTDQDLVRRAGEQGIRISCLSEYMRHPERAESHQLVVNYSGVETARLPEAVARLERALLT